MYSEAHDTARMATRLFPADYRSWSLWIDVYSADPNWSAPYPPECVERAVKLYRVSDEQNPNFEQWLANYNLWMQQMQRVVDLCNKIDVEQALSILGCVYLRGTDGIEPIETITYDDLKRRHHGGRTIVATSIEDTQFLLMPRNGLTLKVFIDKKIDTRSCGDGKLIRTFFYKLLTSGNVLDALSALDQAAGR